MYTATVAIFGFKLNIGKHQISKYHFVTDEKNNSIALLNKLGDTKIMPKWVTKFCKVTWNLDSEFKLFAELARMPQVR